MAFRREVVHFWVPEPRKLDEVSATSFWHTQEIRHARWSQTKTDLQSPERRTNSDALFRADMAGEQFGDVAEWLRSGLQIRVRRFDSGRRLQYLRITASFRYGRLIR